MMQEMNQEQVRKQVRKQVEKVIQSYRKTFDSLSNDFHKKTPEDSEDTIPISELFKDLTEKQKDAMTSIVADIIPCPPNMTYEGKRKRGRDIMSSNFARINKNGSIFLIDGKVRGNPKNVISSKNRLKPLKNWRQKGDYVKYDNCAVQIFLETLIIKMK